MVCCCILLIRQLTLFLVPPPPLPATPPPTSYRRGHATELLEQSLQNLKANDKDDFRSNAGKIISFMLESHLNEVKLDDDVDANTIKTPVSTKKPPLSTNNNNNINLEIDGVVSMRESNGKSIKIPRKPHDENTIWNSTISDNAIDDQPIELLPEDFANGRCIIDSSKKPSSSPIKSGEFIFKRSYSKNATKAARELNFEQSPHLSSMDVADYPPPPPLSPAAAKTTIVGVASEDQKTLPFIACTPPTGLLIGPKPFEPYGSRRGTSFKSPITNIMGPKPFETKYEQPKLNDDNYIPKLPTENTVKFATELIIPHQNDDFVTEDKMIKNDFSEPTTPLKSPKLVRKFLLESPADQLSHSLSSSSSPSSYEHYEDTDEVAHQLRKKPELISSHARQSMIERNQEEQIGRNLTSNNRISFTQLADASETASMLAEEGKHPVCCCCNTNIQR